MTMLLVVIYLAFISLGLPDSLLGSAWPAMYGELGVLISSAGMISMTVSAGTIVSSLNSHRVIKRLGTGKVTAISVLMTAVALLGISYAGSYAAMVLWAIPLGLGAGSVDSGLNGFVALHYKASHMNWLHSFWGLGASGGPVIMSLFLARGTWRGGYRTIAIIQFVLVAVIVLSLPLWKKVSNEEAGEEEQNEISASLIQLSRIKKAKAAMFAFFFYCSLEATVGLWGSTYLVLVREVSEQVAAGWISLYFIGITAGRMLSGFLTLKLSEIQMIKLGVGIITAGVFVLFLPVPSGFMVVGLFLIGLGCGPIFPGMLHETPNNFGREYSQALIGVQMASAYVGITLMPPLFGMLGAKFGYWLFPFFLAAMLVLIAAMIGRVYGWKKQNRKVDQG